MGFKLSKDEFIKQVNFMYDEPNLMLDKMKGHSDLHYGSSQSEHLNRLFTEKVPASCSFLDKETMDDAIVDAIYFEKDRIYNWLTSDKKLDLFSKEEDKNFFTYSFGVNLKTLVGTGIKRSDMQEYKTTVIRIVLQRDASSTAPLGFFLKTAYPDIRVKEAELTGNKIDRMGILRSDKLKTNFDRTFYILKNRFPNINIRHKAETSESPECIKISFPSNVYGTIDVFLNKNVPDRITYFSEENGRQQLSMAELFLNDENAQAIIAEIYSIQDMVLQGHAFVEQDLIPIQKNNSIQEH